MCDSRCRLTRLAHARMLITPMLARTHTHTYTHSRAHTAHTYKHAHANKPAYTHTQTCKYACACTNAHTRLRAHARTMQTSRPVHPLVHMRRTDARPSESGTEYSSVPRRFAKQASATSSTVERLVITQNSKETVSERGAQRDGENMREGWAQARKRGRWSNASSHRTTWRR